MGTRSLDPLVLILLPLTLKENFVSLEAVFRRSKPLVEGLLPPGKQRENHKSFPLVI